MKKKSRSKTSSSTSRPVLQPGEHLDVLATSWTIQNAALELYKAWQAGDVTEQEALRRNKELRAASRVVDDELRRERNQVKMGRDLIQFLKHR